MTSNQFITIKIQPRGLLRTNQKNPPNLLLFHPPTHSLLHIASLYLLSRYHFYSSQCCELTQLIEIFYSASDVTSLPVSYHFAHSCLSCLLQKKKNPAQFMLISIYLSKCKLYDLNTMGDWVRNCLLSC